MNALFKNIAILIDADNSTHSCLGVVLTEIEKRGHIAVKRAYGNWQKGTLRPWIPVLKEFGFKAEQQFDYVAHKNATDMALVIGAMDLLHGKERYDAYVILSSDSDFTPLCCRLREACAYVVGVGKTAAPKAFQNACDEFWTLEKLIQTPKEKAVSSVKPEKTPTDVPAVAQPSASVDVSPENLQFLRDVLKEAFESRRKPTENEYADLGAAGSVAKQKKPDFDLREYGFKRWLDFLLACPNLYAVKQNEQGKNFYFKVLK